MSLTPEPASGRSVERGVAEVEDAPVGGHQPVPPPSGVEAMPTMGWLRRRPPVDP